jgi:hypothetical protein
MWTRSRVSCGTRVVRGDAMAQYVAVARRARGQGAALREGDDPGCSEGRRCPRRRHRRCASRLRPGSSGQPVTSAFASTTRAVTGPSRDLVTRCGELARLRRNARNNPRLGAAVMARRMPALRLQRCRSGDSSSAPPRMSLPREGAHAAPNSRRRPNDQADAATSPSYCQPNRP